MLMARLPLPKINMTKVLAHLTSSHLISPHLSRYLLTAKTGMANAAAGGRGSAFAAGNAQQSSLKAKESGVGQESKQGKSVKQVDHLGIEG